MLFNQGMALRGKQAKPVSGESPGKLHPKLRREKMANVPVIPMALVVRRALQALRRVLAV
jgi:hypothetical protein